MENEHGARVAMGEFAMTTKRRARRASSDREVA
jgi:hypothetical protein